MCRIGRVVVASILSIPNSSHLVNRISSALIVTLSVHPTSTVRFVSNERNSFAVSILRDTSLKIASLAVLQPETYDSIPYWL